MAEPSRPVDEAQMRGALRALRALQVGGEIDEIVGAGAALQPGPVAPVQGSATAAANRDFGRAGSTFALFLGVVCLMALAVGSFEGPLARPRPVVPGFRSMIGGPRSVKSMAPAGAEKEAVVNPVARRLFVGGVVAGLSAGAWGSPPSEFVGWGSNIDGCGVAPADLGPVVAAAAGDSMSVVIRVDGTLRCWGKDIYGQLAAPSESGPFVQVAAGLWHGVALRRDGVVRCWGRGNFAQASVPSDLFAAAQVTAGHYTSVAISPSGAFRAWGSDLDGQLSMPATTGPVLAVAAGDTHMLAIRAADRTVRAWGRNTSNQCTVPANLGPCVDVKAGGFFSTALKQDGSVACWGSNSDGQLSVPTNLGVCRAISTCYNAVVAVRPDGSLVAWGQNASGQLNSPPAVRAHRITGGPSRVVALVASADCNEDGFADLAQIEEGRLADFDSDRIPDLCQRGLPAVAQEIGTYPVAWRREDGGNGHWYGAIGTGGDWYERQSQALAVGGHLLAVQDRRELAFAERTTALHFYLGAYRLESVPSGDASDGWRWVTGEPFSMALRCDGGYPAEERWGSGSRGLGCIGESSNGAPYPHLMEWEADCNADGVVDYGQVLRGELLDRDGNGVPDACQCLSDPVLAVCCTSDLDLDGEVGASDISVLLLSFGDPRWMSPAFDLDGDGEVGGGDISMVLLDLGPCR